MNVNHLYNFGTINEVQGGVVVIGADGRAEAIEDVRSQEAQAVEDAVGEVTDYSAAVGKCFKNTSVFVREKVKDAVENYYRGVAANLTLIEVTLFDHCLIYKRNSHTPFVKSLIAWGILNKMSEVEVKKLSNLMASKYQEIPKGGYKVWDDFHENDKTLCADIGMKLGPTIPYRIELEK